jgi:hypothetical protein
MNPNPNRLVVAGLAALGTASAIPIPLAQLDFAGVINAFNIDSGDLPPAVRTIVGVAGFLTIGVIALAVVGVGLTLAGAPSARPVLIAAAVAGLVTALPGWIPAGVVLGAAAMQLGRNLPAGNPAYGETQPNYGPFAYAGSGSRI